MSQQKPIGKYGAMIQKARNPENQKTILSDEIETGLPEGQEPVLPENQKTGIMDNVKEEEVNLSIKVPKRLRRHWVSEAKKHDTSLTAVIIASLKEKLGEPQDT
jgi:hypothetical protein